MTPQLLVGTRKGLFIFQQGTTSPMWRLLAHHFVGVPVSALMVDPRDGRWLVALRHGHFGPKLHCSDDQGASWQELVAPAFPPESVSEGNEPPAVDTIWSLAAAGADMPGVVLAGAIPAALFMSGDHGSSWGLVESLWTLPSRSTWFGGGTDSPGLHSICLDPQDSKRVTVAISCGGVWRSEDGMATWQPRTQGMCATYMPPERQEEPEIQDPHRIVSCHSYPDVWWCQHHCGIFRSTDDMAHWHSVFSGHSDFGFAVAAHPNDPDTAWFVPAASDEARVPDEGDFYVMRTRDGGQHMEKLYTGLPSKPAYHLVYRHALAVDSVGCQLAFGSTTGSLWLTADEGDHWIRLSAELPPIYCLCFC
ncbi:sialidase family protein [Chitinivorax sp. B]|uniref:WD40/YVTN/BNR-like repeat-containing protein n=1 Tax=Chitinivorax sp. B TaxID=2502235 RepID=UPI0010F8E4F3|nr:sialidase family protein [Chitinivorax sp. B]